MEVRTAAEILADLRALDRKRLQRRRTAARAVVGAAQALAKIRADTAAQVEELRAQLKRDEADALRRVAEAEARTGAAVLAAFEDFEPQELATLTGVSVRALRDWTKSAQSATEPDPVEDATVAVDASGDTDARVVAGPDGAETSMPSANAAVVVEPPWNGGVLADDGRTTGAL
ncbi:MAG: hypothetical protein ABIQ18_16285 [Umezawaea sp.]